MSTKHTPGPWACTHDKTAEYGLPRTIYAQSGGLAIAEICGVDGDIDRWLANARLIAAAPELLGCLRSYVELEESAAPYSSSPMREKARAAIAKAEGRD